MRYHFLILLLFSLFLMMEFQLNAQHFSQHQWQDRVILIHTADVDEDRWKNQLAILAADPAGLAERKLVVYQIRKGYSRKGTKLQGDWTKMESPAYPPGITTQGFEIVLIGLDGGVKLRQSELLSLAELYALIDGMPMRRAEIRRQGGQK
jgi:hypothetical protein